MNRWAPFLPVLIILAGFGAIAVAVAADFVGFGEKGLSFGPKQIEITIIGFTIVLVGVALTRPVKQRLVLKLLIPFVEYEDPGRSTLKRMGRIMLLAIWFGLFIGVTDLLHFAHQKYTTPSIPWFGPDFVWMAPMAAIWLYGSVGLILCLVSWRWPGLVPMRKAPFVFAFFVSWDLIFKFSPSIHLVAILLLAAGLAVIAARFLAAHPQRFYGLVRRSTILLFVLLVGLAVGVMAWQGPAERRAVAALPPAQADAPNVLLITLDTVRARSLSLYGYDRPTTPNLERLAEDGVRFDWAISTSSWTLPSHGSMFTGRFLHELWRRPSDSRSKIDNTYPTLAQVLSDQGYESAGFVGNLYVMGRHFGLDRGFIHYEDYFVSPKQILRCSILVRDIGQYWSTPTTDDLRSPGRKDAAEINQEFLGWLSSRREPDRPFFVFLNYFDAHDPYVPPPEFAMQFAGKTDLLSGVDDDGWGWEDLTPEETQELNDAYDASLAYLDSQIGVLFADLQKRGLLDNTLVIIVGDHGEQFGEHGLFLHHNGLYLPTLHVPLVISFPPGAPTRSYVSEPVTLRDIPATVVDLIELETPETFPGETLARYWNGTASHGESGGEKLLSEIGGTLWVNKLLPSSRGDMQSLVGDGMLYIRNGDGIEELYDIENDRLEQHNLASSEESRRMLEDFRSFLKDIPAYSRYFASGDSVDPEQVNP